MTGREITIGGEPEPEASPKPKTDKRGLVKAYDPKIAEKVLLKVADGATLREIAAEEGMPTKSTIQRWIMKYPELATAWKAARELSASSLEEEALDMARTLRGEGSKEFSGTRVRAFDVAMNQFRWSAAHRDPQQFGQTTTPSIVVPIQINTSLDLGQGGVKVASQENTYEVAAKINNDYNASDAQIEGTDYTLEPGKLREADGPGDDAAGTSDAGESPFAPLAPKAIRLKASVDGRTIRPKKGHKTARATQNTINRRKKTDGTS
jgi:hypothetical protein